MKTEFEDTVIPPSVSKTKRVTSILFILFLLLNLYYLSLFEWKSIDGKDPFQLAIITFSQTFPLSPVDRSRFDNFFSSETNRDFDDRYFQNCARRQASDKPRLFAAMLSGKSNDGYGSVVSNAFNAYLIAEDPNVDRIFALLEAPGKFPYSPPSDFFDDFAGNSSCPLFVNLSSRSDLQAMGKFEVSLNATSNLIEFSGADQAVLQYFGPGWLGFRNTIAGLSSRDGTEKVFAAKSGLVRAMWRPKPALRDLLRILWAKAIGGNGSYFAVHLRRGDKITSKEMDNLPVERYLTELFAVRNISNSTAFVRNVFVMHDDPEAFAKFRSLAGRQFYLFELRDLLRGSQFDTVRDHIVSGQRGGDSVSWQRHTRELILSMTLTAMADQVVCTFSSNLCRFIALIRGDLSVFYSLDSGWYAL